MEYNFKGYKISGELLDYIAGRLSRSGFLGFTNSDLENEVISLVCDLAEAKGLEIRHKSVGRCLTGSSIPEWGCWWKTDTSD